MPDAQRAPDYNTWVLTQWKAATGGQGDFYEWERANTASMHEAWSKTAGGQGAAAQENVNRAGGDMSADPRYAAWDQAMQAKYGADYQLRLKGGHGSGFQNGQLYFDPNDAFPNWVGSYQEPSQTTDESGNITAQIQAFINSMMGPVSPDDPTVKAISAVATNTAQAYGGRAGVSGRSTMGQAAAASLATAGLAAYTQQRQQLGLNAMGTLSQRDIQLGQLQQGWAQMKNDLAGAQADAGQAKNAAVGSVVGGVIGAIPGIIAAPYTGGASLGLIGAGSAIGGAAAGSMSQSPAYRSSYGGPRGGNPYTGM